jgi:hypothetical protein
MKFLSNFKYLLFIPLFFFAACSMSKVSKISIKNKNPFPIKLTITAQNKNYTADVAANSSHEGQLNWSDINKVDGDYAIMMQSVEGTFNYNTSYYRKGELSNYLNFEVMGNQVVAEIND